MGTSLVSIILSLVSIAGCINYPEGDTKMEIPLVKEGDTIIEYTGFTLCYDERAHIPLWVAYELTSEETNGPYSRKGKNFQPDLRQSISQADTYDYSRSGWSRGHMAPAADFKWDDQAMAETFYLTNICPQDEQLNNRYWNTLENKVREWAKSFGSVCVVTGPIVGKNVNGTIGSHHVVVPDAFYKAVLAFDGENYISIAFIMENSPEPRHMRDCAVTVNELEELTGIDFFVNLDDSYEETVESQLDFKAWRVY